MIVVSALLVLAAQAPGAEPPALPWELDWPENAYWYGFTSDQDQLWVMPEDIERNSTNGTRTIWLRGNHSRNPNVPYRTSLWRIRFDCRGGMTMVASTTRNADGSLGKEWDGMGVYSAIRPGTVYRQLQSRLCSS